MGERIIATLIAIAITCLCVAVVSEGEHTPVLEYLPVLPLLASSILTDAPLRLI